MAAGPWGALVGAAIGAVGGFARQRAQNRKIAQMKAEAARMKFLASPQHLNEVMTTLQPLMKNIVASGLGPQFQQSVNQSLAEHGLTGTGVGEAMRTGAAGAPALFTAGMTEQAAEGQVGREMGAEQSATDTLAATPVGENPLMGALLDGARGYLAGGGKFGKTNAAPTDPNAGVSGVSFDPTRSAFLGSGVAAPPKADPYSPTAPGNNP
jgi:hypothetical protein